MKKLYGLTTCPECGCTEARVTETKGEGAMRWCPNLDNGHGHPCHAQYFARKRHQIAKLLEKVRPGTGTGSEAPPVPEPKPEPQAKPAPPVPEPQPKHQPQPAPSRAINMPGF